MSNPRSEEEEDYIGAYDVAEEIPEDLGEPEPIEEDDIGETEEADDSVVEIDMSNNSWAYFDEHKDSIFKIVGHPTLPIVVTGAADDKGYIWTTHLQPPKLIGTIDSHKESIVAGGFTSDGNYLITGDMDGKIVVHKAFKKGQVWKLFGELDPLAEDIWISVHDSEPVFAVGGKDGSVYVYELSDSGINQIMAGFSHSTECTNGKFLEGENLQLVTCSEDSSIIQWNCFSGQVIKKFSTNDYKGANPPWVSLAIDKNIAALGSRDGDVFVFNTDTFNIVAFFKAIELRDDQDSFDASIEALSWSSANNILAVGLVSGDLYLFDTRTWKLRKSLKYDDAITKVQFVPKSSIIFVASMNGKVYKLDVRSGSELHVAVGHNMGVLDFVFQDSGKKLITAGDEGVSLIFQTE